MHTLILTPTPLEAQSLRNATPSPVAICGFGPVGAAVGSSLLLDEHAPDRVILVGIAGSLNEDLTVGQAYQFQAVVMYGVGIRDGGRLSAPHELGFDEMPVGKTSNSTQSPPGEFSLATTSNVEILPTLLTVCESVDSVENAKRRASIFPQVVAEDMESYAVAMACFARGIPLLIIRGISNIAGDRAKLNWRMDAALSAAADATRIALNDPSWTNYSDGQS